MRRRNVHSQVLAALTDTPVVLLHGARQTGKTTLARALAAETGRVYLTLDQETVLAAALEDPEGMISGLRGPVVIDEVQRAPQLLRAIKLSVDADRRPGRFLLTGSANVLSMPRVSESLAGRMQVVQLWPFSQGEIEGVTEGFIDRVFGDGLEIGRTVTTTGPRLEERVLAGGYPEVLTRSEPARRAAWYESYIGTILTRDVRDLAGIEGVAALPRLLRLLATRTSGLLNYADVSRGLGIPQTTLKRYIALLEATFLFTTLPSWTTNQGLRLTKAPKVLLGDTGLAGCLLGADEARLGVDSTLRGALLETFVALELLKQAGWSRTRVGVHHFRTAAGREVDLVLEDERGRIVGIEVKAAAGVGPEAAAGLRALREAAGERFVRGVVLHAGTQIVPFDAQITAAPVASLWSAA